MKNFTIVLLFITSGLFAQTQEEEIIYTGLGKIVFADGTIKEGEVYHSRVNQRKVSLKSSGDAETIKTKDLKEFFIGDLHFVGVKAASAGVNELDFAILKSAENAKVKLYEVCWQQNVGTSSGGNNFLFTTYREYYAQFPSMDNIKPVGDVTFMPFPKKVSKLVESCPELAKKIAEKEKGYTIGLVSTDEMKLEVFSRIATEYESCK